MKKQESVAILKNEDGAEVGSLKHAKSIQAILLALCLILSLIPSEAFAEEGVALDSNNFPDTSFRTYVSMKFDKNQDDFLSTAEIEKATEIKYVGEPIQDLTGIQYLTNLQTLDCYGNSLTTLNLSGNTALTSLNCGENPLTELNVSKNTALTKLMCTSTHLETLDLSQNTALISVNCSSNRLSSLNVSANTALQSLNCFENQLTVLDVSKNPALTSLKCGMNRLTGLDVSKNINLEELSCSSNRLTELDVSKNTMLKSLNCEGNRLTTLELSKNAKLTYLDCLMNEYAIQCTAERTFDLTALPGNFDVAKASNWSGGMAEGNTLTVADGSTVVTYTYDCKSPNTGIKSPQFILRLHEHDSFSDWQSNGDDTHTRSCTAAGCSFTETGKCSGGTATTTKRAICEVCGQPYGKYLPGSATISGTDVLKKQGKEVVVDLNLNANTGLASMLVQLDYDKNVLEFISAENGEVFDGNSFIGPQEKAEGQGESGAEILSWQNGTLTENVTKTGKLARLKFKIKDDAAVGKTKIRFLCDGGKYEAIDAKGDVVIVTANDATVEVVDFYYGDIDGNDKIDVSDVLRLRRYFAKWNGYTIDPKAADLDSDGQTTLRDVTILERHIAGWRGYENLPMLDSPLPIA